MRPAHVTHEVYINQSNVWFVRVFRNCPSSPDLLKAVEHSGPFAFASDENGQASKSDGSYSERCSGPVDYRASKGSGCCSAQPCQRYVQRCVVHEFYAKIRFRICGHPALAIGGSICTPELLRLSNVPLGSGTG